ncbi:hypothetical protein ACIQXF_20035 [Lysinibacillus sp. NPDC097231]|uniref:hypothetical protein n=1 Tax=Lysinibacillus sp. NPDC097231 TaxID=3364142 RepID=UPI00381D281F
MEMQKEHVIALIWDFDKTLIAGDMQEPLFNKFKVSSKVFWEEVDNLSKFYLQNGIAINQDNIYLNHILTYVNHNIFKNLSNKMLFDFGSELKLLPGLPDFFSEIKDVLHEKYNNKVKIEHYIVSNGLKRIIMGSDIYQYVEKVWGSEYIEVPAVPNYLHIGDRPLGNSSPIISQVGYAFDHTSKTRTLFEINKGINKYKDIRLNQKIPLSSRRIPFEQMIYIADGESDIPAFSLVNKYGGKTFGVYPEGNEYIEEQVKKLYKDKRIMGFGKGNYTRSSYTYNWIINSAIEIAENILENQNCEVKSIGEPLNIKF